MKEKMKVLTHQFDQLKEEIIAKEMDLVNESQGKSKVMREKDGLAKDIEKVKSDAREADNLRSDSEKKVKRLEERIRGLEGEMTVVVDIAQCVKPLKGKLGEIFLSAQSFYLTLTKRSFNRHF